jgi:hypothetical protein
MQFSHLLLLVGGGFLLIAGILLLVLVFAFGVGRRRKVVDPEAGLDEDLSQFPPPPKPGTHRLRFEGLPARVRLVVLAGGKNVDLNAEMAESLLQSAVHGLGKVAECDKPRVRVWPPQLSQTGFAPKFFRHVLRPEPAGEPSNWILVAGPARVGTKIVLVGMALWAAEPSLRGNVSLDEEHWSDKLRIQFPE